MKARRRDNGRGKTWYAKRMNLLTAIKAGSRCADCGYSYPPEAMQFDHTDGSVARKRPARRSLRICSVDTLAEELAFHVDVVCANCHAVRTHARGQYQQG